MLTRVEFISPQGETLSLPMMDASSGYLVRSITGLDPVKATLVSSDMAQVDGATPQAASRGTRNIVMKVGLKPNYSTQNTFALRQGLYKWFMPKQNLTANFYMDGALFATSAGVVESCENSMFSQDQEVDISLIHYDPDFYSTTLTTIDGSTVSDTTTEVINYPGTSDCGIVFTLTVSSAISGFTLSNTRPDGTLQTYQVVGSFVDGDVVTVTSIPRQKALTLMRSSIDSSVLYFMQPGSDWISLQRGANDFRAFDSVGGNSYTVAYTTKYGGF
jgi:Siphovirus-type tail component, C-terminal domain